MARFISRPVHCWFTMVFSQCPSMGCDLHKIRIQCLCKSLLNKTHLKVLPPGWWKSNLLVNPRRLRQQVHPLNMYFHAYPKRYLDSNNWRSFAHPSKIVTSNSNHAANVWHCVQICEIQCKECNQAVQESQEWSLGLRWGPGRKSAAGHGARAGEFQRVEG